jgi:uncharacterized protein
MIASVPFQGLRAGFIVVALAAFVLPAVAQRPPQQPATPSSNAVLLAREIITVKGASKMYEPVIVEVVDRATAQLMQQNPMLSKDLLEIAAKIKRDSAPRVAEMLNEVSKMYAARFTEAELKDVLAFYKSPVGQKIIITEPAILDQSVAFAEAWATKFSEEVLAQVRAEMKKRGHEM